MSVRSCFVVSGSNGQNQLPYHYAQSQPQLSHSFSQPFISRMSNSADHLSSLSHLGPGMGPVGGGTGNEYENSSSTLPFHEHVKNSAAHRFGQKKQQVTNVTADSTSDVNVIGTPVRIQVGLLFINICVTFVF